MKKFIFFIIFINSFLFSEDLWIDKSIYSDHTNQYKVGEYIILDFKEKLTILQQVDTTKDKKYVLKLIPDKLLFDYLPNVSDERSSQSNLRLNNKDKIELSFKLPMKVVSINQDVLQLEGSKQFTYNNVSYLLLLKGETNPNFIKGKTLKSEYLGNYAIEIQIIERPANQNLQLDNKKIEINDETKRKIFLEYLRNILKDQNINVP